MSILHRNFLRESKFSTAVIDRQIDRHGVDIEVYPAIICPCQDPGRGKPLYDCDKCEGTGFQYGQLNPMKALLSARSLNETFKEPGVFLSGRASATFKSDAKIGNYYKIRSLQETIIVNNEVFARGSTFLDGSSKERIRFKKILNVLELRDLNRAYIENVDFQIAEDNRTINWISGGDNPVIGDNYSIAYETMPEYIVIHTNLIFKGKTGKSPGNISADLQRLDAVRIE